MLILLGLQNSPVCMGHEGSQSNGAWEMQSSAKMESSLSQQHSVESQSLGFDDAPLGPSALVEQIMINLKKAR